MAREVNSSPRFVVSIKDTRRREDKNGKEYTVYVLELEDLGITPPAVWSLEKRFKEFEKLYCELVEWFGKKEVPKLPPKKLRNMGEEFIAQRKAALQGFLTECFANAKISNAVPLINWIQIRTIKGLSWDEYYDIL
eukprot:GEZU01015938.1.p1 GENE.GEZU01015938.1~~GEZU01015938.1.p1  ORF type:complete len:136 (-),score=14.57 GEZU01015938.1:25-432(-)